MKFNRFEEILVWQKAKELAREIYVEFSESKDYGFKDQIQRASVSIMNNIAEGYERQGNKEFKSFLYVAKGSCAEVRSMLCLALELHKINEETYQTLFGLSESVAKMLSNLIKTLSIKENKSKII